MNVKVGFVAVMTPIEEGSDKARERMEIAVENLKKHGLEIVPAKSVVSSKIDGLEIVKDLIEKGVDLLVMMQATWGNDATQLAIAETIGTPVVIWSIPYPETYSLASGQHIASVFKGIGIHYKFIYGEPTSDEAAKKISKFANVVAFVRKLRKMRIGRIGPPRRMTRIMNPMDSTYDEIDFQHQFGSEIVDVEIDELLSTMGEVSSEEVKMVLDEKKAAGMIGGKIEVNEEAISDTTRAYISIKRILEKYKLDAITVQCYPDYNGLPCLASCWLAEEGLTLGCEGDIGHTMVCALLQYLTGKPVVLSEVAKISEQDDTALFRHCGNASPLLAEDISYVFLRPGGWKRGIVVQFPMKPTSLTMASLWGRKDSYRMLIENVESVKLEIDEWSKLGGGLLAKIRFKIKAIDFLEKIIREGGDHHCVVVPGDVGEELNDFCYLTKVKPVTLSPD